MPIDRKQNLNEKQKLLTRPLLPYYSRAGTLQGLLLGRATQNVFGYRDIQGTDLIRVRRLHPGFVCSIEGGNGTILVHDCRGWESIPHPTIIAAPYHKGLTTHATWPPRPHKVKLTLYIYTQSTRGYNNNKNKSMLTTPTNQMSH